MEQKSMISEWTCGIIYNYEIEIGRVVNFALVIFSGLLVVYLVNC